MGYLVMVLGGSPVVHRLGDIGREKDGLFVVHGQRGDDVVGNWFAGYGFVNCRVRREHTRKLTHEEANHWHRRWFQLGSSPPLQLEVDPDEVDDGWQPKET